MDLATKLRKAVKTCGRSRYRLAQESKGELSQALLSAFLRGKTDLSVRRAGLLMKMVGLDVVPNPNPNAKSRVC